MRLSRAGLCTCGDLHCKPLRVIVQPVQELANANPVGTNLRRLRAEREITVETLARNSGVSVRTIAYIEGGTGNPRLSIIEKLADALAVSPADLLASSGAS